MNHCRNCGNNIPDEVETCKQANYNNCETTPSPLPEREAVVEEFQKAFPLSFFATENFDVHDPLVTEMKFAMWQEKETQKAKYRAERALDFVLTTLQAHTDQQMARVREAVENIKVISGMNDEYQEGFFDCRDDILTILTTERK